MLCGHSRGQLYAGLDLLGHGLLRVLQPTASMQLVAGLTSSHPPRTLCSSNVKVCRGPSASLVLLFVWLAELPFAGRAGRLLTPWSADGGRVCA